MVTLAVASAVLAAMATLDASAVSSSSSPSAAVGAPTPTAASPNLAASYWPHGRVADESPAATTERMRAHDANSQNPVPTSDAVPSTTTTAPIAATAPANATPPGITTTTTIAPVLSAPIPGWTSPNWSGYVLAGAKGGYRSVGAEWSVPTLDCGTVANGSTSDWVGVNGWNGAPGLMQVGTTTQCLGGQELATAVWADAEGGDVFTPLFNVAPGDTVSAQVAQGASGAWSYTLNDLTSGQNATAITSFVGTGTTAEWIGEDTAESPGGALYPLADFGAVNFSSVTLTVSSGAGTLPSYADAIAMVASSGDVEALPTPFLGSAATGSFTIDYEAPGSPGSNPIL